MKLWPGGVCSVVLVRALEGLAFSGPVIESSEDKLLRPQTSRD